MIETIYSSESGDAGKVGKAPASFKMPKNIRQVGKSNAVKKIYVEDYVMTFIRQLTGGDFSGNKLAVLVGQCIKLDNCRNIFVTGAAEVKAIDTSGDIVFSNDIWNGIYEDIKKFFADVEIVGWFLGGPGYLLEDEEKIQKIHVDNFAGQDKVLLTYDNMEREEAFYSFENNRLCKQEGYYIYYEKNEEMQAYMIEHKKDLSGEVVYDDKVSKEIRTVLQNKKPIQGDSKSAPRLIYAAGTLLAVIILAVGAAILNNYDQMKSMQETMDYLSRNMQEIQTLFSEDDSKSATGVDSIVFDAELMDESGQSLDVEVVPGEVKPLEEASDGTDDTAEPNEGRSDEDRTNENRNDDKPEPSDGEAAQAEESNHEPSQGQKEVKYYTVVKGDTLAGISYKLYNTYRKVDAIKELNNIIDQDLIYIGQKLIVP